MKAWKTSAIQDIDLRINNFGYEAEIAIMANKKKYRIKEVPISYKKRTSGESKIRFIRDIFIVSKSIFITTFFRT